MLAVKSRYAPCAQCGALNMSHLETCYRCKALLHPTAREQTPAEIPAYLRLERRTTDRFEVSAPGHAITPDGDVGHVLVVRNIGEGGLMFDSDYDYPVGCRVRIRFVLHGAAHEATGLVRHTRRVLSDEMCAATGIEFEEASPALIAAVRDLENLDAALWFRE